MKTKMVFLLVALFFGCTLLQAQTKTVELFNGENLNGWGFVLADDTKKAEEVYSVKEGVIHISGEPFGYMYTEEEFSNFHLYIEWRWPEEASNSGIFLYVQNDRKVWPNAIECQLFAGSAGDFIPMGGGEFIPAPGQDKVELQKKNPSSENPPDFDGFFS